MNLQQTLDLIHEEQNQLNIRYQAVHKEYRDFILDKKIPLLERWHFFITAPSELKTCSTVNLSFKSKFLTEYMDNMTFTKKIKQGQKIVMAEVFKDYIQFDITQEDLNYLGKQFLNIEHLSKHVVEEGMEEILNLNLEYMKYRW